MKPIKSVSGIRGILNKTLLIDDITSYVLSFSKIQKQKKLPILIARDSRTTGRQISSHIIKVLTNYCKDNKLEIKNNNSLDLSYSYYINSFYIYRL